MLDIKPKVKVIFATGYDKTDYLNKELSGFSVISKLFNIHDISEMIRKNLIHESLTNH